MFDVVEKPFFKKCGLLFEENNSLELKLEVFFDQTNNRIHCIILDNELFILGDYDNLEITEVLPYVRLNNKLNLKQNLQAKNKF